MSRETLLRIVTEQLGVSEYDIEAVTAENGDACLIGDLGAVEEDCEAIRRELHEELGIPMTELSKARTFAQFEELLPRAVLPAKRITA